MMENSEKNQRKERRVSNEKARTTEQTQLYQRRFLRPDTHFAAFFEIYKIATPLHRSKLKIFRNFCQTFSYFC